MTEGPEPCSSFADFDLFADGLPDDLYPLFDSMRATCPVARSERYGGYWIVTRHADVSRVLRDTKNFSSRIPTVGPGMSRYGEGGTSAGSLVSTDPPEHARYRRLVAPPFSPAATARREDLARDLARAVLDEIGDAEDVELMAEFAGPYTCRMFFTLLGLPLSDIDRVSSLKDGILHADLYPPDERVERAERCASELAAYVAEHLGHRRAAGAPRDDEATVFDLLVAGTVDGEHPLTDAEAVRVATQVLLAGIDTTATVLCNMIARLAGDAELQRRFSERPELRDRIIDELMRLEPLITAARVATGTQQIGNRTIEAGESILVLTAAAARDPEQYEHPASVVTDRPSPAHLSWGVGAHRCLGMHLALLEIRVAMDEVHRRWQRYSVPAGAEVRRHAGNLMGVHHLPLRVEHPGT